MIVVSVVKLLACLGVNWLLCLAGIALLMQPDPTQQFWPAWIPLMIWLTLTAGVTGCLLIVALALCLLAPIILIINFGEYVGSVIRRRYASP